MKKHSLSPCAWLALVGVVLAASACSRATYSTGFDCTKDSNCFQNEKCCGSVCVKTEICVDAGPDAGVPTVTFGAASQSVGESLGTATVTASLSAASGQTVTVPYTVTGTATPSVDYALADGGPLTIAAGQTSANITFTVVNDALDEADKTVIVTMGTPTNATLGTTTVHTVTITDDDATPTVAWSAASQSVGESLGTVTVTASLSAASGQTVTVPYTVTGTATPSVDYTLADGGPLTIAAGQTSANITFNVVNDALDETDETVIVTMGTPTNATLGTTTVHTATILDDDGVLSLLAGALGGPGNVDGTGADARHNQPYGVAADGTNLFVADTWNHTIRRIVIATGEVTTLAGTAGSFGIADGTGAGARFYFPVGVATDGTNLFVADMQNQTVRRIVIATGVVTTLAGAAGSIGIADGTGAAARFYNPYGVATDGTNLFVADTENHTIRRIVIDGGVVTTLAGTAGFPGSDGGTGLDARFHNPYGVATDGTNVFVADTYNQTIRRIVIATGAVTTLAGTAGQSGTSNGTGAAATFYYPRGVSTNGTDLFVAEPYAHTIRRIAIDGGAVTAVAGTPMSSGSTDATGAAARFNNPSGVVSAGANLFVGDTFNHTIRKVVIDGGVVTTFAGKAPSPGSTDATGAAARFNSPTGVAAVGTNLFVADTNNHAIRQIVIATGVVTTFAGMAGSSGSDGGTGATARFNQPTGVATDGTNLFVADTVNHTIRQIVIATGEVTTLAGTAGLDGGTNAIGANARFYSPYGVATDGTNVFVADTWNHTIRRIVIATGAVTTLAGTAGQSGTSNGAGTSALFYSPRGVATDGTNVFVADTGNHTIRRIVIDGGDVTTPAGAAGESGSTDGPFSTARFLSPRGVATDGVNVFVADTGNYTIRKLVLSTALVTTPIGVAGRIGVVLGVFPGGLNVVDGIAISSGQLYLAVSAENSLLTESAP